MAKRGNGGEAFATLLGAIITSHHITNSGPPGIPVLKVKNSPRLTSKFPKIFVVRNITFLVHLSILDLYWRYMFT